MTPRYARREPIDALEIDGESLLLMPPDQMVRLSPIGTAIFAAAAGPTSLEAIVAAIQEQFGSPADGDVLSAVTESCEALALAGVLEPVTDE